MIQRLGARRGMQLLAALCLAGLAACGPDTSLGPNMPSIPGFGKYGQVQDGGVAIPAVPRQYLTERNVRQVVEYRTDEAPGTIIVDPYERFLYHVMENDRAMRYSVGVGEEGRGFSGNAMIPMKREWPTWTPTANMLREDPETNEPWRGGMPGGLQNPLGARALYLYRNGRDTLYRIHGTPYPQSVGHAVSSGCIRLFNQDILHLYERVDKGTKVVVLSPSESGQGTVPPEEAPFTISAAD